MTIKNQDGKNKILGGGEPNLRSKFGAKEFYFYCFGFLLAACLLLLTTPILAQVQLETGLPGIPGNQLPVGQELPSYIRYLFVFGLSLITIMVLGRMIVGGITYILAAGNAAKVEDAKDIIFQALLGFGVLLVSYLFLRTINPDLVNLRNPNLTPKSFQFKDQPQLPPGQVEVEGAPCKEGEISQGLVREYAICINGQWRNTENMLQ